MSSGVICAGAAVLALAVGACSVPPPYDLRSVGFEGDTEWVQRLRIGVAPGARLQVREEWKHCVYPAFSSGNSGGPQCGSVDHETRVRCLGTACAIDDGDGVTCGQSGPAPGDFVTCAPGLAVTALEEGALTVEASFDAAGTTVRTAPVLVRVPTGLRIEACETSGACAFRAEGGRVAVGFEVVADAGADIGAVALLTPGQTVPAGLVQATAGALRCCPRIHNGSVSGPVSASIECVVELDRGERARVTAQAFGLSVERELVGPARSLDLPDFSCELAP